MGPAILGNAAVQINVMVNTNFASRIPGNGPVSWLGYAFRFMQLPLGLFGVAIASATLPSISRSAGAGNFEEFRRTLVEIAGHGVSVDAAVLHRADRSGQHHDRRHLPGRQVSAPSTPQQTALALSCYAVGPGRIFRAQSAESRLLRAARRAHAHDHQPDLDRRQLRHRIVLLRDTTLGHAGLALSTSGGRDLRRGGAICHPEKTHRRHPRPQSRGQYLENHAASAVMGAAVLLSSHEIETLAGRSPPGAFVDLAVSIPSGLGDLLRRLPRTTGQRIGARRLAP